MSTKAAILMMPRTCSVHLHYMGDLYKVLGHCCIEESAQEAVLYQELRESTVWARPLSQWHEDVPEHGKRYLEVMTADGKITPTFENLSSFRQKLVLGTRNPLAAMTQHIERPNVPEVPERITSHAGRPEDIAAPLLPASIHKTAPLSRAKDLEHMNGKVVRSRFGMLNAVAWFAGKLLISPRQQVR